MSRATIVTFTSFCSAFTSLRNASRSVMSASSSCVTCGIITQFRASAGPEIFLMRESATRSTSPYFSKSTFGQGARSRPGMPAGASAWRGLVLRGLDVLLEDPPLPPGALDLRQVNPKLPSHPPHAGPGVDRPAAATSACSLRVGSPATRWTRFLDSRRRSRSVSGSSASADSSPDGTDSSSSSLGCLVVLTLAGSPRHPRRLRVRASTPPSSTTIGVPSLTPCR